MSAATERPGPALPDPGAETWAALAAAGLDLRVPVVYEGRAAWLVANTRALWGPFAAWLRAAPARAELEHPLDAHMGEALAAALSRSVVPIEAVRTPWEPGAPDFVGLAVAAGLLWRSPSGLGIHPVYGPWVALRALVVTAGPASALPEAPPAPPCPHCEAACRPLLATLSRPTTEAGFRAQWRPWAELRRACPTGAAHRYGDLALEYHYTHDRALLRRLAAGEAP